MIVRFNKKYNPTLIASSFQRPVYDDGTMRIFYRSISDFGGGVTEISLRKAIGKAVTNHMAAQRMETKDFSDQRPLKKQTIADAMNGWPGLDAILKYICIWKTNQSKCDDEIVTTTKELAAELFEGLKLAAKLDCKNECIVREPACMEFFREPAPFLKQLTEQNHKIWM